MEELLAQNEGKTVEFKESTKSLNGILKTVVAFANTAGGTIVIGIKDGHKEIVGLSDVLGEEERVANAIADGIAPLLIPDIMVQTIRGKELLLLKVPHSAGPYYIKSEGPDRGVYVRFGSTNRMADSEMLSALRLLAENIFYDELPHPRGKINHEIVKDVFSWVKKRPSENSLENLGIISRRSGQPFPTNGGILLFGSNRRELFPDAVVRCARFAGTSKEKILDHTDIEAPLPYAIDPILDFIERNLRKEAKIGKKLREDIFEYPPYAIREAVINALLHTDYAMKGCNIQIAIFDDRIEFTNPGGLPFGLTIEKAIAGASRLRNRVIGRVFRELKLIEQWGSGLSRILAAAKRLGLKTPLIEELNNQFRLTLYSAQVEEVTIERWGKVLLNYLKDEESITTKDAAKLWKITTRTARMRLKSLQEGGFLIRVGTSENDPNQIYISAKKT